MPDRSFLVRPVRSPVRAGALWALFAALAVVQAVAATAPVFAPLPDAVAAQIRRAHEGLEVRTLHRRVDLDGDDRPEWVVYLVGPMVCGTGGCPLWVFTPQGEGWRRVGALSVVKTPVRALPASGPGHWRDLVVHVGGGGARSAEMALAFDGRRYPANPTVRGPHVRALDDTTLQTAEVLIGEDFRFEDTTPLPVSGPSFDCRRATRPAERLVCQDPSLAALDRELAALYATAQSPSRDVGSADREAERSSQRRWLAERDDCAGQPAPAACLADRYRRRIVTFRIWLGALGPVPPAVGLRCAGAEHLPATAVFYAAADPKAVVLTLRDRQAIAFAAPSGSGTRYTAPQVDYWEHQGEATIEWFGLRLVCRVG